MKKYIIILMAFAFIFGSCSDYLDKFPENEVDFEEVDYSDLSKMFEPVSGVYATARTGRGFSFWAELGLIAVRGDDIEKGSNPSDQIEFQYCKDLEYFKIKEYWALNATWESLYYLVQSANSALVALDNYSKQITTDSDKKLNTQYQAEVRFIRAYALFFITRLWGDVPLLTDNKYVKEGIGLSSHQEILTFVSEEMDFCEKNLPALRPNEMPYKGQVTMYTALALKAKTEAILENWDAVLAATNTIVGSGKFSLYPDFYQYFKKPGRLSDETLYELQYSDFGSNKFTPEKADNWFEFQGPRSSIQGVKPMSSGWGFMVPSESVIKLFADRGETVRATTTFLYTNATTPDGDFITEGTATEPTVYNGKAYMPSVQLIDGIMGYGVGNNIRMLRYADVLLLNAEAKVRKGQNGDKELNEVRTRAKMPTLTNATLDQILEERQVEFACEWGERFFDLVRTKRAATVLPNFEVGKSEFYPIPQAQIDIIPEWGK